MGLVSFEGSIQTAMNRAPWDFVRRLDVAKRHQSVTYAGHGRSHVSLVPLRHYDVVVVENNQTVVYTATREREKRIRLPRSFGYRIPVGSKLRLADSPDFCKRE